MKKPFLWIAFPYTYNTYRGYIKEAVSFFSYAVIQLAFGSNVAQH
jgi:hypothetical protein